MSTSFGEVLAATGLLAGVSPANLEESHPTGLPVQRWNALSKRHAALPPNLCAFGVSFDTGRSRNGIFRRRRSTIDEGGTRWQNWPSAKINLYGRGGGVGRGRRVGCGFGVSRVVAVGVILGRGLL